MVSAERVSGECKRVREDEEAHPRSGIHRLSSASHMQSPLPYHRPLSSCFPHLPAHTPSRSPQGPSPSWSLRRSSSTYPYTSYARSPQSYYELLLPCLSEASRRQVHPRVRGQVLCYMWRRQFTSKRRERVVHMICGSTYLQIVPWELCPSRMIARARSTFLGRCRKASFHDLAHTGLL